jgi:hypothetical protein
VNEQDKYTIAEFAEYMGLPEPLLREQGAHDRPRGVEINCNDADGAPAARNLLVTGEGEVEWIGTGQPAPYVPLAVETRVERPALDELSEATRIKIAQRLDAMPDGSKVLTHRNAPGTAENAENQAGEIITTVHVARTTASGERRWFDADDNEYTSAQLAPYLIGGVPGTGDRRMVKVPVSGFEQIRAEGFAVVVFDVEGALTLRYNGWPPIGLIGAAWGALRKEHLDGVDLLYVAHRDGAEAGMRERLREIGWSGTARIIKMEDVNAVWRGLPGGGDEKKYEFLKRLEEAIEGGAAIVFEPDLDHAKPVVEKPVITVGAQGLAETSDMAWAALKAMNDPPILYRNGDALVRVAKSAVTKAPCLRVVNGDRMTHRLCRVAEWVTKKGDPAMGPPAKVVADMLADDDAALPLLTRIATVPTFVPGGRLLETPGYDEKSGVLYAPPDGFTMRPVPEKPTDNDVERARALVLEMLHDFPFVSDADRAAAFATLLSSFARSLVDGNTPLMLIEKPTPRTGAGLLIDCIGYVVFGHVIAKTPEAGTEEEWRKQITSCVLLAPPYIVLDNLHHRLNSASLAAVLTSGVWRDRILGVSQMVTLPVLSIWVGTANNPQLSTEMSGRTVSCRMDAKVERPGERADFKHHPLLPWVAEHRTELIWSCLTLIRRWIADGSPAGTEVMGGFEGWCRVLGGILRSAGVPGLLANREQFYRRVDDEGVARKAFVAAWWRLHADKYVAAKALVPVAVETMDLDAKTEKGLTIKLGKLLKAEVDRRYILEPGFVVKIERSDDTHEEINLWRLMPVVPVSAGSVSADGKAAGAPDRDVNAEDVGTDERFSGRLATGNYRHYRHYRQPVAGSVDADATSPVAARATISMISTEACEVPRGPAGPASESSINDFFEDAGVNDHLADAGVDRVETDLALARRLENERLVGKLLHECARVGVTLTVTDDGGIVAEPASVIDGRPDLRAAIQDLKPFIVKALTKGVGR